MTCALASPFFIPRRQSSQLRKLAARQCAALFFLRCNMVDKIAVAFIIYFGGAVAIGMVVGAVQCFASYFCS